MTYLPKKVPVRTCVLVAVLGGIIAISLGFVPFQTEMVPAWRIRVVNERGEPYSSHLVRQFCDNYWLDSNPCQTSTDFISHTDKDGYVEFPRRTVRLSLFSRIVRPILSIILGIFAHGSIGKDIFLDSSGPKGYRTLKYVSGEPLPTEFILPSKEAN